MAVVQLAALVAEGLVRRPVRCRTTGFHPAASKFGGLLARDGVRGAAGIQPAAAQWMANRSLDHGGLCGVDRGVDSNRADCTVWTYRCWGCRLRLELCARLASCFNAKPTAKLRQTSSAEQRRDGRAHRCSSISAHHRAGLETEADAAGRPHSGCSCGPACGPVDPIVARPGELHHCWSRTCISLSDLRDSCRSKGHERAACDHAGSCRVSRRSAENQKV